MNCATQTITTTTHGLLAPVARSPLTADLPGNRGPETTAASSALTTLAVVKSPVKRLPTHSRAARCGRYFVI